MLIGAPRTKKDWWRVLKHRLRLLGRSVVVINDTPHRIALGVALGTFVAYQPVVGFQMMISGFMALLLRANVTASLPPAWITNPLTIPPIFYCTYWLGAQFTGGSKTLADIKAVFARIGAEFDIGMLSGIKLAVTELARGFFWPMIIGGTIIGVVNAILFYWITHHAVRVYQRGRVLRMRSWHTQTDQKNEPPPRSDVGNSDPSA